MMKCIAYDHYGGPEVLHVKEVPKPSPKADEVLIRVHATTASAGDWRCRSLELPSGFGFLGRLMLGITGPRQPILGTECSGVIEAVGASVSKFKVGDAVVAFPGSTLGCYAQYRCISENGPLALKPEKLSFAQAASLCFGGITMLEFYRRAGVKPGDRILVNGASGCVGLAAVQLGKHMGGTVTGVCSGANAEMVKSMGAARVVDYTTATVESLGEQWDVVVDTAGTMPFSRTNAVLAPGGRFIAVLSSFGEILTAAWNSYWSGKTIIAGPSSESPQLVRDLCELAAAGHYHPFVDRVFPFEQVVEAHKMVDSGRKRGSVVIAVMPAHTVE